MVKLKKGFTLIEVALFLVITGALFVAVTIGVQNSITQQRINDSVQNFAEFLRTVYSGVLNVENLPSRGNTEQAIYGKLITFGEQVEGEDENKNKVYVYTVVGKADIDENGDVLTLLNSLGINVVERDAETNNIQPYGIIESYTPRWSSTIEQTCEGANCSYDPYVGAVLIVRHPKSGTVYTYVMDGETINVNDYINSISSDIDSPSVSNLFQSGDTNYLTAEHFKIQNADFCLNPYGDKNAINRRNIRIVAGARNASGVEIVPEAGGDVCQPH